MVRNENNFVEIHEMRKKRKNKHTIFKQSIERKMEAQSYGEVVPPIVMEIDPPLSILESGEKSPRLDFKSLVEKHGRDKVKKDILNAIKLYLFK